MQYIGRIITKTPVGDIPEYIEVSNDFSKISLETIVLPTLLIGFKNVTQIFGNVSLLNRKLSNNLFWTFTKRERRTDNEKDIQKFISFVKEKAEKYNTYHYFSFISADGDTLSELMGWFASPTQKIAFRNKGMLYVYFPQSHSTIGFSIEEANYIDFPLLSIINTVEDNLIFINDSNSTVSSARNIPFYYYLQHF